MSVQAHKFYLSVWYWKDLTRCSWIKTVQPSALPLNRVHQGWIFYSSYLYLKEAQTLCQSGGCRNVTASKSINPQIPNRQIPLEKRQIPETWHKQQYYCAQTLISAAVVRNRKGQVQDFCRCNWAPFVQITFSLNYFSPILPSMVRRNWASLIFPTFQPAPSLSNPSASNQCAIYHKIHFITQPF